MLPNLIKVIDERFLTRKEAAEVLFPGRKSKESNLSSLLDSDDPNKVFRKPTIEALERVFPEYNVNWLLYGIEPKEAKPLLTQPAQPITTNQNIEPNQDDLMNRITLLTEQLNELKEDKKMLMHDKEMLRKDKEDMRLEIERLRSQLGDSKHLTKDKTA